METLFYLIVLFIVGGYLARYKAKVIAKCEREERLMILKSKSMDGGGI